MSHCADAKRHGEDDHKFIGLIDRDTGDVLISGLNRSAFDRQFRPEVAARAEASRQATRDAKRAARGDVPAGRSAAGGRGSRDPDAAPRGRQARILIRDADLSDNVELLFRLDTEMFPGQFDPTVNTDPKMRAEELAHWIEDMGILAHRYVPELRAAYDRLLSELGYERKEAV